MDDLQQSEAADVIDVRTDDERALDQVADLRDKIARERATAQALTEFLSASRAPAPGSRA